MTLRDNPDKSLIFTQLSLSLISSVLGTSVHYAIMLSLVEFCSIDTTVASTCGAVIGAVIIYLLNYFMVFKSVRRHREAVLRFLGVACLGVTLNTVILKTLTSVFDQHYLVLQLFTTAIIFGCNFATNRGWTFASKLPPQKHIPEKG